MHDNLLESLELFNILIILRKLSPPKDLQVNLSRFAHRIPPHHNRECLAYVDATNDVVKDGLRVAVRLPRGLMPLDCNVEHHGRVRAHSYIISAVKYIEKTMHILVKSRMGDTTIPRVVALVGQKQSGKDTVADYMNRVYGYENIKFADPMKQALCSLFGWSKCQVEDPEEKEVVDRYWGVSPRRMMQIFGTEIVQYEFQKYLPGIKRNFFVKSLLKRIEGKDRVVISDMRFLHEFQSLKKHDPSCLVVRLVRPDIERLDSHPSEVECETIPADVEISNDRTITHLYWEVEKILTSPTTMGAR